MRQYYYFYYFSNCALTLFSFLQVLIRSWLLEKNKIMKYYNNNNNFISISTEILYIIRVVQHCFAEIPCDVGVILRVKHVDYMNLGVPLRC